MAKVLGLIPGFDKMKTGRAIAFDQGTKLALKSEPWCFVDTDLTSSWLEVQPI